MNLDWLTNQSVASCCRWAFHTYLRKARSEIDKARSGHYVVQTQVHGQKSKKYWDMIKEIGPKANTKINGRVDEETGEKIPIAELP